MTDLQQYVAPGTERRMEVGGCVDGSCGLPEPYVNLTPSGNVWITLPGDNESHMLAPGEARRLMRELEAVV